MTYELLSNGEVICEYTRAEVAMMKIHGTMPQVDGILPIDTDTYNFEILVTGVSEIGSKLYVNGTAQTE